MRTTDFCFPLPDYEYPRLVSYRHLFEAYASPLADRLAPATRRPVNWRFTTPNPLRWAFSGWRAACFFRALPMQPYL